MFQLCLPKIKASARLARVGHQQYSVRTKCVQYRFFSTSIAKSTAKTDYTANKYNDSTSTSTSTTNVLQVPAAYSIQHNEGQEDTQGQEYSENSGINFRQFYSYHQLQMRQRLVDGGVRREKLFYSLERLFKMIENIINGEQRLSAAKEYYQSNKGAYTSSVNLIMPKYHYSQKKSSKERFMIEYINRIFNRDFTEKAQQRIIDGTLTKEQLLTSIHHVIGVRNILMKICSLSIKDMRVYSQSPPPMEFPLDDDGNKLEEDLPAFNYRVMRYNVARFDLAYDLAELSAAALAKCTTFKEILQNLSIMVDERDQLQQKEQTESSSISIMSQWVSTFFGGESQPSTHHPSLMEMHQDVGNIQQLDVNTSRWYRNTLKSILTRLKHCMNIYYPDDVDRESFVDQHREASGLVSRVAAVIETLPVEYVTEECLLDYMKFVKDTNTILAARKCNDIYNKYKENFSIPFELVLEAYRDAGVNSSVKRLTYALEAVDVLQQHLEENPKLSVDHQMKLVSVLMQCFNSVDGVHEEQILHKVSGVFSASLNKTIEADLNNLQKDLDLSFPISHFPFLDILAEFYLKFDNKEINDKAKVIMQRTEKQGSTVNLPYPAQSLIEGYIKFISKGLESKDNEEKQEILREAMEIAHDVMSQGDRIQRAIDSDCFHELLLILHASGSDNLGKKASELLALMNLQRVVISDDEGYIPERFSISLPHYHTVLSCWQKSAQHDEPCRAARQAYAILERLEVQSKPLLLSDKEVVQNFYSMYDTKLQPALLTYQHVLDVCAGTSAEEEYEEAAQIAGCVLVKMIEDDMYICKKTLSLARECCYRIHDESSEERRDLLELTSLIKKQLLNAPSQAKSTAGTL